MAANYLHGVETIEIDKGPRSVSLVKTAVIGLIGTAAAGPVNTPTLVTRDADFAQWGENIEGSTILDALDAVYDQKGTVCIVINVLDPALHRTFVDTENVTVAMDGSFKLAHAAISSADPVVLRSVNGGATYTLGVDFTMDTRTGRGQRVPTGAIASGTSASPVQLKASYSYTDPTLITPADIIGGIDAAGRRLGIKAFRDCFNLFGYFPKMLISPVFASLASVSAELIVQAHALRAIAFIDAPAGITPQQAISGRGPMGAINFNTSSDRAVLGYPYVKVYKSETNSEVLQPASARLAGALSRKDQESGYWWSLSNTEVLGITGLARRIDAMVNDPNSEANLLNEAGITTFFNSYGTGIRTWGNRSAAWPGVTHPKNFVNVRRVADVIAESLEYFTLQFLDRPLDNAVIDDLVESGNRFIRKLKGDSAILDGQVWFDPKLNETTELAAGHLTLSYDFMPPPPLERVTYQATINIDYLKQLGQTA